MVSQVGSIGMPNYGVNPLNSLNPLNAANTTNTNSLLNFGSNPLLPNGNNYEDDMFMPQELKLNNQTTAPVIQNTAPEQAQQAETSQVPQPEKTATQPQITDNTDKADGTLSELNGSLVKPDGNTELTENGNPYNKTSFGKTSGTILGFLAPLTGKIIQLFKGGNAAKLFKFKQLVTVCPMIAIAGYGIGSLLDGCINSNRAKKADEEARLLAQSTQTTLPMNMMA